MIECLKIVQYNNFLIKSTQWIFIDIYGKQEATARGIPKKICKKVLTKKNYFDIVEKQFEKELSNN